MFNWFEEHPLVPTVLAICFIIPVLYITGKKDNIPGSVTVTSNSYTCVSQTYNGAGYDWSGLNRAIDNALNLSLEKGDTATVTFRCDSCGDEQVYEVTENFSKVLHCNCPENMNLPSKALIDGNAREYSAIMIKFKE